MQRTWTTVRVDWFGNIRLDILSGILVALALIPESLAFAVIAGVDPSVTLYASFCIAVTTAFLGGRPGMISAATGAMALVLVHLISQYGVAYVLPVTILTGLIQILFGVFRLGTLLRFVSRSVVHGFVNALAILIFVAQLPEVVGQSWQVWGLLALGLALIYLLPRVITAVPAPLISIVVLTTITIGLGLDVGTVGDKGVLPTSLPSLVALLAPLTLDTVFIVAPYALTLAVVGLLESLMTAVLIDDITDTRSDKNRECIGQGSANIIAGVFGGMAGCALIGQSMMNIKAGGRGRLSTLVAGVVLLFLVMVLRDVVQQIPMVALAAVMMVVCVNTFQWSSLRDIRTIPVSSTVVTFSTVAVVVYTHNLAQGVFVGVLLSGLFFAHKISRYLDIVVTHDDAQRLVTYQIIGQVFFASATRFADAFDYTSDVTRVTIDVSHGHFWDVTSIAALDKAVLKYRSRGILVDVIGLNAASATMVDRHALHPRADSIELGNH
ncbi:MAG: SulP family inorganic anion transporter [Roseiflexaceae bacterium]